jgi:hypothetical protein
MLDVAKLVVTIIPCMEGGWRWIWAVKLVGSSVLDVRHEEGRGLRGKQAKVGVSLYLHFSLPTIDHHKIHH